MTDCARKLRAWDWDATGLACSCPACHHCLRHRSAQKDPLPTQPFRIARMIQRFLPLLFPAVDQPIAKVSSRLLFDCPRLVGAHHVSRVGIAHLPPPRNQLTQPSKQSVQS